MKAPPMSMVGFPLLLIPLAIYNMIVFLMPGVGFSETLFRIQLVSGEIWAISLGDILLALGILLLLLEVIKAARPGGKYLTDHLLSLLLFGAAAGEFVMWPKFANSTFFLLALLTMVEFFAGIALRTKRSARAVVAAPVVHEPAAPEPQVEPSATHPEPEPAIHREPELEPKSSVEAADAAVPVPAESETPVAVPAATSVAESVLMDHPAPGSVQSSAPQSESAPQAPATETHHESGAVAEPAKDPEASKS